MINTQMLILILVIFLLLALGGLVYCAIMGIGWALFALGIIVGVLLIGVGLTYSIVTTKITIDNQQRTFLDNAKENLSIMAAMQSIQNKQNSTILQQLSNTQRLPEPNGIFIEDGVFDGLED